MGPGSARVILKLVACLASRAAGGAPEPAGLTPVDLRCESLHDPLGIDEISPRLGWTLESGRRGERQTAYRILVASSPEALARDEGDLWDTGKVPSSRSVHVVYRGKALASRQACFWKVMAWDRDGEAGPWSAPARWEMGLLAAEDWTARWIDAGPRPAEVEMVRAVYCAVDGSASRDVTDLVAASIERGEPVRATNDALGGDPAPNVRKRLEIEYTSDGTPFRADVAENAAAPLADAWWPYLRMAFRLEEPVASARLYVTALGVYETCLNGRRVGDEHLAPGWTDYRKRVHYRVHDVTAQLQEGENVLGALVGPGWFAGRAGLFHARAFYGESPALLAQLEVTHPSGSVRRIVSDGTWLRHDGPILAADLMDGEIHDARRAIDGWCTAPVSADGWTPVEVREESRFLQAAPDFPVRVLAELPARTVSEPRPGRFTFDLGQNMVGVVRLRVQEAPGTVLTVRHAEILGSDGTIYTDNLRGAAATDTYVCRGGGVEVWQPRFTFHGFRHVEVTGLRERPTLDTVTGIVLGSDLPPTGEFSCSDPRLDRLHSNIVWGLRGNFLSIPTDCPQRDERMGWTGDIQAFAPTAAFLTDVAPFLSKWLQDLVDAQRDDGAYPDVAPVMDGLSYGTPAWGDAGTLVPWTLYRMYGDPRILERNVEAMQRWVEWRREHSTDLICDKDRGGDYGDWLHAGADTPRDLIGTAFFARSTDLLARTYEALGREEEARRTRALFEDVRAAFRARYVEDDGRVRGGTQTGTVLALAFGLVPEELRDAAVEHLVTDLRSRGWRLTTGFVGTGHLLPVLDEAGRPDAAYRLLLQDVFPSWLFPVEHGATTIWERWDGWTPEGGPHPDSSMNSFNHYAFGSCGEWLFRGVAGIRPGELPGFEDFVVAPRIGGGLSWASASFRSVRGEIATDWERDGDRLALRCVVPVNTTATVLVPGEEVREGGKPVAEAEGVEVLGRDGDALALRVGSGRYAFESRLPAPRLGNPIFPGWYADPEAVVLGDRYWIYPTYSAPYDQQVFFDAFSSMDLVSWTKHPRVLEAAAISWARRAMWAPSVVEKDGRYYFFFSANDIQDDAELGGIGVAVSDSPAGPFEDHLGKPLVGAFHHGAQPIDQFVFRDEDGQDYLIYGGWGHCNIARLRDDYRGFEPFPDGSTFLEITPEEYVEGPFLLRRDDRYYFFWSEGGWTGPDYSVAYAVADSPLGPFSRAGRILQQDPAVATGAGHASVLEIPGTGDCYLVYHRRPLGETDRNHRVVCIDRLTFDAGGRIEPVTLTFERVAPPR